jgi:hypothetical protein
VRTGAAGDDVLGSTEKLCSGLLERFVLDLERVF